MMRLTRANLAGLLLGGLVLTALFLGLAGFAAARIGTEISLHGWIALSLGVFSTLAVAALFIGLLFHSRNAGYDKEAHDMAESVMGKRPRRD